MAKQEEPFASVVLANRITNFREEEFIMASVSLQHIYKVYAESFESPEALDKVLAEATEVVDKALAE